MTPQEIKKIAGLFAFHRVVMQALYRVCRENGVPAEHFADAMTQAQRDFATHRARYVEELQQPGHSSETEDFDTFLRNLKIDDILGPPGDKGS